MSGPSPGRGNFPAKFELYSENPVHYHCCLYKDVRKPEIMVIFARSCYHPSWFEADVCRFQLPHGSLKMSIESCMIESCHPRRMEQTNLRLV